jgi:hypothetical protein
MTERQHEIIAFRGSDEVPATVIYNAGHDSASRVAVRGPWGEAEAAVGDLFTSLRTVRAELERAGWFLAVNGARRDVVCFGATRDMNLGGTVQRIGGPGHHQLPTFAAAPRSAIGTVAEQDLAAAVFFDSEPSAAGIDAVVPAEIAEQDTVFWNDQEFAAAHTRVPHRQADHVRFGDHEAMLSSLVESWFTQTPVARAGHRAYQVHGKSGDELTVSRWRKDRSWHNHERRNAGPAAARETKPLSYFDRLSQVRIEHLPSLDTLLAPPSYPMFQADRVRRPSISALLKQIEQTLAEHAPSEWRSITVTCQATADWQELTTSLTQESGAQTYWLPPAVVGQLFRRLRAQCYEYPAGTWFTAELKLVPGEHPQFTSDTVTEPGWQPYFEDWLFAGAYGMRHELAHFPRTPNHTPDWFAATAARINITDLGSAPFPQGNTGTLLVRTFDGMDDDGNPKLFRTPVSSGEKDALLSYLTSAPVVLASRGTAPDLLDPKRAPKVPMAFHTDGRWVWSSSVAYYLEHHDVSPDQGFLGHIRDRGHRLPDSLPNPVRARALAVATDAPELEPGIEAELEHATAAVREIAVHLGIDARFWSVGSVAPEGLTLQRKGDRYEVFWSADGEKRFRAEFDSAGDAATYLIGFFYSYAGSLQRT